MKKRYLSMLLAILMLLALTVYAFAEEADGEVSAAAADNTIDLVSLDNTAFNLVTYTVRLNITQDFADQGYCLGMEISNDSSFQQGQGRYFSTDLNPNLLYEIPASGTMQIQRHSICVVPNVTYYLRPVLYDNNRNAINRGNYLSFTLPADDSGYTVMPMYDGNQSSEYASERGWLHGKFTADKKGWYAITADSEYDFVSYVRTGCSAFSSVNNSGSGDPLILFFQANQDETVYVFGTPPNNTIGKSIRIVDAEDLAPTENSVEAGAPYDATNMDAFINFTISTTPETAAGGYQAGIVFGDPGTDPETWQGKIKIGRPEYEVKSDVTTPYRNTGAFVPGMDVDFQAALFTVDGMEILARGDEVRRLQTLDNFNNMTGLTKDNSYPWSTSNMPMVMFHYTAPADGMYAVQGTGMNILRLTDRRARDLGTGYLLGSYLREGETFFPIAYYTMGNSCSIEVKDGLTTFRQVQQSDGASQFLDETTPVWFQAPESGIYRIAIDQNSPVDLLMVNENGDWQFEGKQFLVELEQNQTLWLRRTTGQVSNLGLTVELFDSSDATNLSDLGTIHMTQSLTIERGASLNFDGTELVIDPGVTLTVNGNAHGHALNISEGGTLILEGADDFNWAGVYADEIVCAGDATSIEVGDWSVLNLDLYGWNENVASHIECYGSGDVALQANITDEADYQNTLTSVYSILSINNYGIQPGLYMNILCPLKLVDGDRITPLFQYHVINDGTSDRQGSLTIPVGATVTMTEDSNLDLHGATFTVNGTLVNNGVVVLQPRDDLSDGSDFVLADGAVCQGVGEFRIRKSQGNPSAQCDLNVASPYEIEELWNNERMTSYRIYNGAPAAEDSISITGFTNQLGGSVYMNVSMSISTETAATECYRGIQYSTDPTFERFDIWGHDPVTRACTDYVARAELTGLVPSVTYYYRAVLFNDTENGWEIFCAQTGDPRSITITETEWYSVPAITMDETSGTAIVTVDPYLHQLYRFIAPADGAYVATGTGLDYTIAIDAAGNRLHEAPQRFWENTSSETCQSVYFWANEGEAWYFAVGSYNEPESTLQLRVSFASRDPATTQLELDIPVTTTTSNLPWCFTAETDGFYHIGIDHPEFGGLAYPLGGNNWGHTGQYFTELAAGESFFFILEFDEERAENVGGMNVSVHSLSAGLAEFMENAANNPDRTFHTVISGGTLRNDLTIPFNVSVNIEGEWKLADGVTVNNYGDLYLLDGGTLNFGSGATLNLKDDAADSAFGWLTLEGGTLNVPENAMSFEGRAGVEIRNSRYATNEAALNAASGIQNEKIHLEATTRSQEEYDFWYSRAAAEGYRSLNLCLENGLNITLTQDLPEKYGIVVNEGTGVTVLEGAEVRLNGFLAMEGGSFTNNGTLIVDEAAEINIWNPDSMVQNNGTIQLYGELRFGEVCAVDNSGSFIVMNQKHLPTEITFSPNLYHYPDEHRLVLPAALTTVEAEAFANTAAWEIDLPAAIDSIGENAFAGSENLFLVVIPNGNAEITGNPFENCDKVTIAAPAPGAVETFATNAGIPFLPLQ